MQISVGVAEVVEEINTSDRAPILREDYHPLRAAKYWPAYVSAMRKLRRDWGMYVSGPQMEQVKQTMMGLYSEEVEKASFEDRPANIDVMMEHLEKGVRYGYLVANGLNVYSIGPDVRDAVKKTSLSGIRLGDLRLPFESIYIGFDRGSGIYFDHGTGKDNLIVDGAYVRKLQDIRDGKIHLEVCLTTRDRIGVLREKYVDLWPLHREPHYTFDLVGQPEDNIEDLLGFAISNGTMDLQVDEGSTDEFRATIAGLQSDYLDQGIHVTAPEATGPERRAAFRNQNLDSAKNGLSVVLGVLCVLTSREDDGNDDDALIWPDDTPRELIEKLDNGKTPKARRLARNEMSRSGFMPIRRVILNAPLNQQSGSADTKISGQGKTSHWRSGHIRRQPHGPKNSKIKIIWIMPTLINDADEDPAGRIIRVSKSK